MAPSPRAKPSVQTAPVRPPQARLFSSWPLLCMRARAGVAGGAGGWAPGVRVRTAHNLSLLTEAVARHKADFSRLDWDLGGDAFAARLGLTRDKPAVDAPELALPDRPSIAVLPFTNMSDGP